MPQPAREHSGTYSGGDYGDATSIVEQSQARIDHAVLVEKTKSATLVEKPKRARRVEFDTRQFVNSHLRAPKGRGGWLFATPSGEWLNFNGTYTEARVAARAARPEVSIWIVLP